MYASTPRLMRCKDRLPELRRRAGVGAAVDIAPPAPAQHPSPLASILYEVERVRGWVSEVRAGTQRARRLLADPGYHTDKKSQEELDATVTACNAAGLKVCGALRQLEAAAEGSGGATGVVARIARVQAASWRRALASALQEQHELLNAARHEQLQLLRHHAHLVNAELTDEECQALLDSQDVSLFVDNVRAETVAARLALRDAEARHAELVRVEAALAEVRDLFMQLAALVASQQDAIDSVEHYALQACDYVGDGQSQLLKGSVVRRKTREKKMGLIICLSTGVLLVLLVLIFT